MVQFSLWLERGWEGPSLTLLIVNVPFVSKLLMWQISYTMNSKCWSRAWPASPQTISGTSLCSFIIAFHLSSQILATWLPAGRYSTCKCCCYHCFNSFCNSHSQSGFGCEILLVVESPCNTEDLLSCWSKARLQIAPKLGAICKMRKFGKVSGAMNYPKFRQIFSKLTKHHIGLRLCMGRIFLERETFFLLLICSLEMSHLRIF